MSDDNDPESITFIGHVNMPPERPLVDLNQDAYMVSGYFTSDVQHMIVNASSEPEALTKATEVWLMEGISVFSAIGFETSKLESLEGGEDGSELA